MLDSDLGNSASRSIDREYLCPPRATKRRGIGVQSRNHRVRLPSIENKPAGLPEPRKPACYFASMTNADFWRLEQHTNEQLLAGLEFIVRSSRQRTAELIAHLAEIETRRLHLEMAYGSLFDYCVRHLGLSEDEACRRIDVARLARRFPALFPRIASGEISLTVAALLKPYLAEANESAAIASVAGKSIQQAREALAALFPRPDVAPCIRKLPGHRAAPSKPIATTAPSTTSEGTSSGQKPVAMSPAASHSAPTPKLPPPIEALSEARYRIQLTASSDLKQKLEQARDLMRHRNANGDLAVVVERALDLLLERLMKERFGTTTKPRSDNSLNPGRISNAARRAVLERDGLQCSWVNPQGRRCTSRAWLELDHRHPRAKGGSSGADNVRVLCRAHNRLAAEHEYGRRAIEEAIAERK